MANVYQDELLERAMEALEPAAQQENWNLAKLAKKVRDYFRRAGQSVSTSTSLEAMVNELADYSWCAVHQALGDRPWVHKVDLVFVLDAAIKEQCPIEMLQQVPKAVYEEMVLAAHDRAFEEQRCYNTICNLVTSLVARVSVKKVSDAVDAGRRAALSALRQPIEDPKDKAKEFVGKWIQSSVDHLSRSSQGRPGQLLPLEMALYLFDQLLQEDALPLALTAECGKPPPKWPFIQLQVRCAYAHHQIRPEERVYKKGQGLSSVMNRHSSREIGHFIDKLEHERSSHQAVPALMAQPVESYRGASSSAPPHGFSDSATAEANSNSSPKRARMR